MPQQNRTEHVVLVSCSKSKLEGKHLARSLYNPSRIFKKRKQWAKVHGDRWGILSARFGFIRPWEATPYYQTHISERTDVWGAFILKQLEPLVKPDSVSTVTILAGQRYIDPIQAQIEEWGCEVENPHEGLRPGERYSALVDKLATGEQVSLDSEFS